MLSLLTSCWRQSDNGQAKDQQKQVDKFYTETGGWDWIRVPLIKPYEAKKIDPKLESSNWYISYGKIDNAINVKDVSVIDSIIYAYCGDSTLLDYKYIKAAWFIFDVKKNIKQGFSSESEFDNYLQSNNYPKPHWQDIDSISEMLGNGGQVPWMPK
ncbi:hypothetical protein COR50_20575 [Chitinophaga caeni]|uniref:Uncharacterized protein n=2 Tax=Chitinophaga caeni TaxID=2029983 RepID=A0A291QZC8_9BACT|nr:hypothetical protein COR50_20575 [Chitinophaga caeni]